MFDGGGTNRFRTSASIDLGALAENFRAIEGLLEPDVALLCVIKADAYGHGAVEVGRRLESLGAGYFGVATVDEGRELRQGGIRAPVLLLSGVMPWESLESLLEYDLTTALINPDMLERIARFRGGKPLRVHVKIDTGMGRLGFGPGELETLVRRLSETEGIEVEGVMSHFSASERRSDYGVTQVEAFVYAVGLFRDHGIEPRFVHMANSGAMVNYREAHFNMVRPGIMLYGCYPDGALRQKLSLVPVMRWTSRVSFVRLFPAGCALSYGGTYVTARETKVAYIPVGYADGFPRALSNRGSVLIGGTRCSIIGRVCMDWVFADVTALPGVGPGDEVVLIGASGNDAVSADEIAEQIGTIPYEVLCNLSRRIPRRYVG
jgi:alanine racemase